VTTIFDLVLIPVAYSYVFGLMYFASSWKRQDKISGAMARKLVHLGIGILVIVAPLLFSSNLVPTAIGISFILITFLTSPISPQASWRVTAFKDGHSLGTVYYSISLTLLLYFFFPQGWIIQVGFLPLVFGDAIANLAGLRWGQRLWPNSKKSLEGSIAGIVATFIFLLLILSIYRMLKLFPVRIGPMILLTSIVAVFMGIVEVISPSGLDNLSIPFVCTSIAIVFENLYMV